MNDRRKQIGQSLVCTIVVIGFVAATTMLLWRPITINDAQLTLLTMLVGALSAKFGDVVQYYIGSSAGSRGKDEALKQLAANELRPPDQS